MNKKVNTILFLIAASLFNLLMMFLLMFIGFAVIGILARGSIQPGTAELLFVLIFLLSLGGSFFIYHRVMRIIASKIKLDDYFHPIIRFGKKGRKKED